MSHNRLTSLGSPFPFFGIVSPMTKDGQSYVASHLALAVEQTVGINFGRPTTHNMSDFLRHLLQMMDPTLSDTDIEALKDDPDVRLRDLMSAMSQFIRRDDSEALARRAFEHLPLTAVAMTGIKFPADVRFVSTIARESGGALIVLDTPPEVRQQRLTRIGLTLPSSEDRVEQERPPVSDLIRIAGQSLLNVVRFDNSRELHGEPSNDAFNELIKLVQEARDALITARC